MFHMVKAISRGIFLALPLAGPAFAQTAEPTSTTATYGNWTVSCLSAKQASDGAAVKVCEMKTQLSVKGNDGATRPILQVALGQPPGSDSARIVLQVPIEVALREPVVVSLDQGPADGTTPAPQDLLVSATYLACSPTGCLADTAVAPEVIGRLKAVATANVTFTTLNAGKKISVPVPLAGFGDAVAALGLAAK